MRDLCMSVDIQSQEEIRQQALKRKEAQDAAAVIFKTAQEEWQKAIDEGKESKELVIWFMHNGPCQLSVVDGEKVQLPSIEYNSVVAEEVRRAFMKRKAALRTWSRMVFSRYTDYTEMHIHKMQKPQIKQ